MLKEMFVEEILEGAEIIKEGEMIKHSIKFIGRTRGSISVEKRTTQRPIVPM